jgi:hypothetical protein
MSVTVSLFLAGAGSLGAAYLGLRLQSARRRQRLMARTAPAIAEGARGLAFREVEAPPLDEAPGRVAVVPDLLPPETFATLRRAALAPAAETERSYVPAHKQGGTLAQDRLREVAPEVIAFYRSDYLRGLVSRVAGEPVQPTPEGDQSSCSVLVYTRPGDHIGWHYDYNFYRGRHFTVLLSVENRREGEDRLSSAVLQARGDGEVREYPTPPNTLVVFEGARTLHRVTRLAPGERRVLISMTFATRPTSPLHKDLARRIKDTAYFGVRALWA